MSSGPPEPDGYDALKARQAELQADREPAESSDGLELSVPESLQSIAVELHRANELKVLELRFQERQNDLTANALDLLRKPAQAGGEGMVEVLREFTSALSRPLEALLGDAMKPKPPRIETIPAGPPKPIELEKDGTRVSQDPED